MKRQKYTLALALIAFISSFALAADDGKSSTKTDDMSKMDKTPMADMLKGKSGDEFEHHYLHMLAMHHKDGIKMARMAVDKAQSSELKQMMQKSISTQQQDIEKMEKMMQKYKKTGDMSKPSETKQMMDRAMSELQNASGSEFDAKFAKHMAMHHLDAIAMSKMAESKAKDSEVKQLASKTVRSQTEERQKLQKMAKS